MLVEYSVASFAYCLVGRLAQLLPEPAFERDRKALLVAMKDVVTQRVPQRLLQDVLAGLAPQFQRRRNSSCFLHEFMIEKRSSHLQSYSHAGAVDFRKNVIRQVGHNVDILNL